MAYTFKHGDRPLDDFTIQRGVGRGGFGEVYYAVSDGGREVALKYLRDNPDIELRGVSHCMNLKSPHLVTIFDVKKSAEGEYFIVMEYVSGPSLRDLLIAESNGLGPQKAAFFVREIARGLSYLHERGIVHRDLKPGNIFYEDGYVKIGDYGLSKAISVSRHSAQTASVGTVHYMAPEIGSGNYSRGVDIYALGVMLYEMLLGKVPFEGSSMGEVLMKHLTAQPEVDNLPAPFGEVIRKSLAKDPNDRYQTVDQMIEVLFGVDDVKQSLVGFNPTSLSTVARHAAGEAYDSPRPSPNPPRPAAPGQQAFGQPAGWRGASPAAVPPPPPPTEPIDPNVVGGRLAKKLDRVTRKLDKKLDKLAGGRRKRRASPPPAPTGPQPGPAARRSPVPRGERIQRVVLSCIMAVGIAFGVGLLIAAADSGGGDREYYAMLGGLSSFLLVVVISGGVLFSHWLIKAKLPAAKPTWASRLVLMFCCVPLMVVATAPLLAELRTEDEGFAILFALLITTLLAGWDERLQKGAQGEMSAGSAFGLAVMGGVLALIFGAEEFALVGAGVAAAASLSVQALSWAFPFAAAGVAAGGKTAAPAIPQRPQQAQVPEPPMGAASEDRGGIKGMFAVKIGRGRRRHTVAPEPGSGAAVIAEGIPIQQSVHRAPKASAKPLAPLRPMFLRSFWSVIAFILAGGTIVLFIVPLVADLSMPGWSPFAGDIGEHAYVYYRDAVSGRYHGPVHYHDVPGTAKARGVRLVDNSNYMAVITGCVACFSFLIFALRKTTERRRFGFWRESLRPFLQATAMTGMGAAITALVVPNFIRHEEELIGTIVGLVFGSLLFLVLLAARGRRRHAPMFLPADAPIPQAEPIGGAVVAPDRSDQDIGDSDYPDAGHVDDAAAANGDESDDQHNAKAG
ncbi:MAG: serine/threonine protein kinase [bacterium]|nr:serine/threonine protein kinase [bacterium]